MRNQKGIAIAMVSGFGLLELLLVWLILSFFLLEMLMMVGRHVVDSKQLEHGIIAEIQINNLLERWYGAHSMVRRKVIEAHWEQETTRLLPGIMIHHQCQYSNKYARKYPSIYRGDFYCQICLKNQYGRVICHDALMVDLPYWK